MLFNNINTKNIFFSLIPHFISVNSLIIVKDSLKFPTVIFLLKFLFQSNASRNNVYKRRS